MGPDLAAEAAAFDRRIEERVNAGFVPDIRRASKCAYFYKSFWRDPHFVNLYVGQTVSTLLGMLGRHSRGALRVLDVGCGPGYITLEFARAGHRVLGIDISSKCVEIAKKCRDSNPFRDGFGSLDYEVMTLDEVNAAFDCVLFTGCLHHFSDPATAVRKAAQLLPEGGLILAYEPCHEQWRMEDAAQVALIRGLLALGGFWYEEPPELDDGGSKLPNYVREVHTEYVTERDKNEPGGQSPHDNSSSGQAIREALREYFNELEYRPGAAFSYRLLGGLRGPDELVHRMADFLAAYEKYAVENGFLRPNAFFFLGNKLRRR